jgi:nucleoside-diphosphate-sugar epimerase
MILEHSVITPDEQILVTGANGFLGARVIETILDSGFRNIRCFVRGSTSRLVFLRDYSPAKAEVINGDLSDMEDCRRAAHNVALLIHCAAGMRGSRADMFVDSVVSSRNLVAAIAEQQTIKRIVHISSVAVYETSGLKKGALVTEEMPLESHHVERNDPYCYAKVKQEQLFWKYAKEHNLPLVVLRPGVIFGPGGAAIPFRVGLEVNQVVVNLGDSNRIPLTYVDNCAEAIVLASTKPTINGEAFNIIDDNVPTSSHFVNLYKRANKNVRSVWIPYIFTQALSRILAWYSEFSDEQIPAVMTPHTVASIWKSINFDNKRAKAVLGWSPRVSMDDALSTHFEAIRNGGIR